MKDKLNLIKRYKIKQTHKMGLCDKCQTNVEEIKVPFLYCDVNDQFHEDLGEGYRQYFVCSTCFREGI